MLAKKNEHKTISHLKTTYYPHFNEHELFSGGNKNLKIKLIYTCTSTYIYHLHYVLVQSRLINIFKK